MATLGATAAVGFGSGMLGAAVMMAVAGAAPQDVAVRAPAVVEAGEFVLRDGEGRQRGRWRVADGNAHLILQDAKGRPRVILGVLPDGTATVQVGQDRATGYASVVASPNGMAGFGMDLPGGSVNIGPLNNGRPALWVTDRNKRVTYQAGR